MLLKAGLFVNILFIRPQQCLMSNAIVMSPQAGPAGESSGGRFNSDKSKQGMFNVFTSLWGHFIGTFYFATYFF